jgi:hypothetical protein
LFVRDYSERKGKHLYASERSKRLTPPRTPARGEDIRESENYRVADNGAKFLVAFADVRSYSDVTVSGRSRDRFPAMREKMRLLLAESRSKMSRRRSPPDARLFFAFGIIQMRRRAEHLPPDLRVSADFLPVRAGQEIRRAK